MRRVYSLIFLIIFVLGCGDSRYVAEKLLWQAQKKTQNFLRGKTKLTNRDYNEVISYYREVTKRVPLEPLSSKAHFIIANLLIREGKYDEAQKELKTVIDNFSSSPSVASRAYFAIGKIFEAEGKWDKAIEEYDKITDLYPLSTVGLNVPLYIMRHYKLNGDEKSIEKAYRSAIRHYKSLIEEYEGTSVAPIIKDYMAQAVLTKGEFKEAITVWDGIDKDYPSSSIAAKAILTKASIYESKLKNTDSAIKEYERFIKRYPKSKTTPEVRFKVAMLYLESSRINKAKDAFRSLLDDYSSNKKISLKSLLGLSLCYRKEADTKKVIETYDRIRKEYSKSRAALSIPFLMGQYYLEEKYNSQAADAFSKAIDEYKKILEDPKSGFPKREVANLLALCYLKSNQVEEATRMLRSLAEKYPYDPVYLIDLATLYRVLNNNDKAVKVYEELVRKFSKNKAVVALAKRRIKALKEKQ